MHPLVQYPCSTTPRTPRKSQKTLEWLLEFIEQKKEWEGELEEIGFSVPDKDLIEEGIFMNYHHFKIKELVNLFLSLVAEARTSDAMGLSYLHMYLNVFRIGLAYVPSFIR